MLYRMYTTDGVFGDFTLCQLSRIVCMHLTLCTTKQRNKSTKCAIDYESPELVKHPNATYYVCMSAYYPVRDST